MTKVVDFSKEIGTKTQNYLEEAKITEKMKNAGIFLYDKTKDFTSLVMDKGKEISENESVKSFTGKTKENIYKAANTVSGTFKNLFSFGAKNTEEQQKIESSIPIGNPSEPVSVKIEENFPVNQDENQENTDPKSEKQKNIIFLTSSFEKLD